MNTIPQAIGFRIVIQSPTKRERTLRSAMLALPECNPDTLSEYASCVSALERLTAAEQAVKDSEYTLQIAMKALRGRVAKDWNQSEINKETEAVLFTW